jgi:hypothetical protein
VEPERRLCMGVLATERVSGVWGGGLRVVFLTDFVDLGRGFDDGCVGRGRVSESRGRSEGSVLPSMVSERARMELRVRGLVPG